MEGYEFLHHSSSRKPSQVCAMTYGAVFVKLPCPPAFLQALLLSFKACAMDTQSPAASGKANHSVVEHATEAERSYPRANSFSIVLHSANYLVQYQTILHKTQRAGMISPFDTMNLYMRWTDMTRSRPIRLENTRSHYNLLRYQEIQADRETDMLHCDSTDTDVPMRWYVALCCWPMRTLFTLKKRKMHH